MGVEDEARDEGGRWTAGEHAEAAEKFSRHWDAMMRMADRGASHEEIAKAVADSWAKDAVKAHDFRIEHYGNQPVTPERVAHDAIRHAAAMNDALSRHSVDIEGPVFRGIGGLTEQQAHEIASEKTLRLGAMSSASSDIGVADSFVRKANRGDDSKHGILFEIRGAKGLPIDQHSAYQGEREVVLSKEHQYRVVKVRSHGDNVKRVVLERVR